MRRAVHDMKEFQLYYSATASLLQEIVMEKYAHIFAVNGVSMDLPLLTDEKLLMYVFYTSNGSLNELAIHF